MFIVTGGAGFIGSALVWKLNQQGIDNILIVDELADSQKWKNIVKLRFDQYIHHHLLQQIHCIGLLVQLLGKGTPNSF